MTHATPRANTARTTTTKHAQSAEAACKALFGRYPEDVLQSLETASRTFGWIRELLLTIEQEARALNAPGALRIASLAEAAGYLACDFGNLADCEREDMAKHLAGGAA